MIKHVFQKQSQLQFSLFAIYWLNFFVLKNKAYFSLSNNNKSKNCHMKQVV